MAQFPEHMYAPFWWELTPEQRAAAERLDAAINEEYRERLAASPPLVHRGILSPLVETFQRVDAIVEALARGEVREG